MFYTNKNLGKFQAASFSMLLRIVSNCQVVAEGQSGRGGAEHAPGNSRKTQAGREAESRS